MSAATESEAVKNRLVFCAALCAARVPRWPRPLAFWLHLWDVFVSVPTPAVSVSLALVSLTA